MSRRRSGNRPASPPSSSRRGAAAASRRPPFGELGATSTRFQGGLPVEEYNPRLAPPECYDVYDRMLRGDAQVQAVDLAISLPIEGLRWWTEPASESALDQEVAARLEDNLMSGMTAPFGAVPAAAVEAVLMGVNLLEPVWELREGMAWLRKLASRHPRTVKRWLRDDAGGIQGIVQIIQGDDGARREVTIPIERLLRFTWRERHGDPAGRAVLRAAYKHWFIKDALYRISNVGLERFWMPVPQGQLPEGYSEDDKAELLKVLAALRAADAGGLLLPPGYDKVELLESSLRVPDIMAFINHHDLMIARAALVQFITLGSSDVGSWALSDSQVTFFLLCLGKVADWICEIIDRYLIPRWCGYNYPGLQAFPRLAHSPVAHVVQRAAIAEALSKLVNGQLITPDRPIEDTLREIYDLPPLDEERRGQQTIPQEDIGASRRYRNLSGASCSHAPTAAREPRPNRRGSRQRFDERDRELTAAKDEFASAMRDLVERQHAALQKKLAPLIEEFRTAEDLSKGAAIRKMQTVEVPLVGKYENLIAQWLREFYATAVERAAEEADVAPPKTIPNAVRTWLATKAQVIAQKHAEALRAGVLLQVLEDLRQELPTKTLLWNAQQASRKRATLDIRDDLLAAGNELTDVVNDALAAIDTEPQDAPGAAVGSGGEG